MATKTTGAGWDALPVGIEFLKLQQGIEEACGVTTDELSASAGRAQPATIEALGTVLSMLYRLACCGWGCAGGDHTIEWLIGRVVNHASGAYRLMRAAYYDESLVLTRGIGETANLLCLFKQDATELAAWKAATRRERLSSFGPAAVRKKIENRASEGTYIDQVRYQKLCELGTHPVPGVAPGHYSGTGRPVLSGIIQEAGVFVDITELSYAVGLTAIWSIELLALPQDAKKKLFDGSVNLIAALGAFTILEYEDLLAKALREHNAKAEPR